MFFGKLTRIVRAFCKLVSDEVCQCGNAISFSICRASACTQVVFLFTCILVNSLTLGFTEDLYHSAL